MDSVCSMKLLHTDPSSIKALESVCSINQKMQHKRVKPSIQNLTLAPVPLTGPWLIYQIKHFIFRF